MKPWSPNEKKFQLEWEMKERKWMRGAPTYIVPTHKTYGFETKVMETLFAQGWKLRCWMALLVEGLIVNGDKD